MLPDRQVEIRTFYIRRPDVRMRYAHQELENATKAVYNHPTDQTRNLIAEAMRYSDLSEPSLGNDVPGMPLNKMIGPNELFFKMRVTRWLLTLQNFLMKQM